MENFIRMTPEQYADQILGQCADDDSIDLSMCEDLSDTIYAEDYDDDDEWANEHEASGQYPAGFDDPEYLDDDFLI